MSAFGSFRKAMALLLQAVGHQTPKQPMEFQDAEYKLELSIEQENHRLDSATVVADQSDRKYFPTFFSFFVGSDQSTVFVTGYRVWKETLCNMIPLGHEFGTKKKKKAKSKSKC